MAAVVAIARLAHRHRAAIGTTFVGARQIESALRAEAATVVRAAAIRTRQARRWRWVAGLMPSPPGLARPTLVGRLDDAVPAKALTHIEATLARCPLALRAHRVQSVRVLHGFSERLVFCSVETCV